jgi:hypothetical protein
MPRNTPEQIANLTKEMISGLGVVKIGAGLTVTANGTLIGIGNDAFPMIFKTRKIRIDMAGTTEAIINDPSIGTAKPAIPMSLGIARVKENLIGIAVRLIGIGNPATPMISEAKVIEDGP